MTYAVLHNPLHGRVYKDAALRMALHELSACAGGAVFGPPLSNPRGEALGGVPYIFFDRDKPLEGDALRRLSRLSFAGALFEYRAGNHTRPAQLIPLDMNPVYLLDESLSSMLKYTGKTNELFTRLMVNLAEEAAGASFTPPFFVLDPLAGKGTTLYEAVMAGHHAYGVEIDGKYPAETDRYMKKFLTLARYKHTSHKEKTGGRLKQRTVKNFPPNAIKSFLPTTKKRKRRETSAALKSSAATHGTQVVFIRRIPSTRLSPTCPTAYSTPARKKINPKAAVLRATRWGCCRIRCPLGRGY